MYEIEKGVEMPNDMTTTDMVEILTSMEIGDSFTMPIKEKINVEAVASSIGICVVIRKTDAKNKRVWRAEYTHHVELKDNCRTILSHLRGTGSAGVTWAMMQKTPPYSQHKPKNLKEILMALKSYGYAEDSSYQPKLGGRPTILWRAISQQPPHNWDFI